MTPRERAERIVRCAYGPADEWGDFQRQMVDELTTEFQAVSNEQLERCRAHDRQSDVAAFHRKFGVPCPERPGWPSQERIDLRVKLIAEELCEFLRDCGLDYSLQIERWRNATGDSVDLVFAHTDRGEPAPVPNFAKAADALIDMEYVILGTHCEFGIDSNPLWAEVHASNMLKEGGATRSDGKIMKPPGFKPPDVASCLRKQGWIEERDDEREGR